MTRTRQKEYKPLPQAMSSPNPTHTTMDFTSLLANTRDWVYLVIVIAYYFYTPTTPAPTTT